MSGCKNNSGKEISTNEADRLHQSLLTIDSHTDTPLRFSRRSTDLSKRSDPRRRGGKLDFPRMQEGGLDGVFFAVFVGQGPRTPEAHEKVKGEALMLFDSIHAVVNHSAELAAIALSAGDLVSINRQGKKAVYIGIENGYPVGNDLSLLSRFYDLGARYITLCHSRNNDICDSSTDKDGPEHGGLSDFGREVVREMNRLGIMIDVSHISDEAFFEVIEISRSPVIASHSNARAVRDHPRNMSDEMLLKLAENGGVIQLCLVSEYVTEIPAFPERDSAMEALWAKYDRWNEMDDSAKLALEQEYYSINSKYPPELATVSQFCDHVDHIVDLIGIDHVGFGSDFDGGAALEDCYDVTGLPNVTHELLRRGYSLRDLKKFWSGNLLRVMKEVEKVAG
ncbi:MAG: membrane dipeptidase [Bacteroides sp. SM23_62]|nr:MAG: membrane dipeptidase [Bacteroides sp. SM23_62]